jgi:hypothetical protein
MPIDPSTVQWDAPATPTIDPSAVKWDDTVRPTTTLEGMARGAAPYAGAMGAGALVGGGLGAVVGGPPGALAGAALGARLAPAALTVGDVGTQLYNVLAQRFGGRVVPTPSNTLADVAGAVGVGRPGAPIAEAAGAGAAGAGALAAALPGLAERVANPVVRGALNAMAAQPAAQTVAGAAGGAGAATAGEYGGYTDPISQMAASLIAGGVSAPVALATANLAARGTNAMVNRFGIIADPAAAARLQVAEGRGPQIVEALRAAPVSETGAPLTTAQASVGANAPAYAAFMQQAADIVPAQAYDVAQAQRAARAQTLARGAGTPEERAALEAQRGAITDPMYRAATSPANVADVTPAYDLVQRMMTENPGNRALMRELRAINRNLFVIDETGEAALRTNAQQVSSILDDLKTSINKQDNKYIKDQLTQVRNALSESIPGYSEAQASFRVASTPINQREGFQFLKEKLEAPLRDEGERPGAFGAAVKALTSERDAPAALRRAISNMPRYRSLEELYSPDQIRMIDAVRLDLARDAKLQELVERGRASVPDVSKVAREMGAGESLPNPLNQTIAIANRIIGKMQGQLDRKLAMELAMESLNPQVAAAALERSMARQAQFERFRLTAPQMMGPAAFTASQLPGMINTLSQQQNQNAMAR